MFSTYITYYVLKYVSKYVGIFIKCLVLVVKGLKKREFFLDVFFGYINGIKKKIGNKKKTNSAPPVAIKALPYLRAWCKFV